MKLKQVPKIELDEKEKTALVVIAEAEYGHSHEGLFRYIESLLTQAYELGLIQADVNDKKAANLY